MATSQNVIICLDAKCYLIVIIQYDIGLLVSYTNQMPVR